MTTRPTHEELYEDGEPENDEVPSADERHTCPFDEVLALGLSLPEARRVIAANFERRYLAQALGRHDGNVTHAAASSGIATRRFFALLARNAGLRARERR